MQNLERQVFKKHDIKSIDQALKVLDNAAKESTKEIRSMVDQDYSQLKQIFGEDKANVKSAFGEMKTATAESLYNAKEQVVATTQQTAQRVDESVHENPWVYIGGAALVTAIAGFLLGRKKG